MASASCRDNAKENGDMPQHQWEDLWKEENASGKRWHAVTMCDVEKISESATRRSAKEKISEKAADVVAGVFHSNQWVVETSSHMWWNTICCHWDPPMQSSDCGDVRIGRRPSIVWRNGHCCRSPLMVLLTRLLDWQEAIQ